MSKTAFIFPGQGAQTAGMGKDFYENSRTAKTYLIWRLNYCRSGHAESLCFEKNDILDKTEYTQAAFGNCHAMATEHV